MKKERQSNFELLRIISILLIIIHHCATFSFSVQEGAEITGGYILLYCMNFGTRIGVSSFVLISGWFLSSYSGSGKKAVRLILQVTAASVFTLLIAIAMGARPGLGYTVKACLPVPYSVYWFPTTYVMLLLLSGYLNRLLDSMDGRETLSLIGLLVTVEYILPTFLSARMVTSNLFNFITLYFIAAWLRRWSPPVFSKKLWLPLSAMLFFGFMGLGAVMLLMSPRFPFLRHTAEAMMQQNMLPTLICSVALFAGIKNCSVKHSPAINLLGASSFGIYLIHSTPHLDWWVIMLRFWDRLFPGSVTDYNSSYVWLYALFSVTLTVVLCTAADIIYRRLLEPRLLKLLPIINRKEKSER